jgi:hypothetical protein
VTRRPRRRRAALIALGAAAVVAGAGLLALWNPHHYVVLDRTATHVGLWALGWLLAGVAVWLYRPRWTWVAVLALPVLGAMGVSLLGAVLESFDVEYVVLQRHVSPDAHYDALLTTGYDSGEYQVWLRSRAGLMSRDRLLWATTTGYDDSPYETRFAGPRALELVFRDHTARLTW